MIILTEKLDQYVNIHLPFALFSEHQAERVVASYMLGDSLNITRGDNYTSRNQREETINLYEFDNFYVRDAKQLMIYAIRV